MNSARTKGKLGKILAFSVCFGAAVALPGLAQTGTSRLLVLWDTLAPLGEQIEPQERSGWKAVPNDLMLLESDPSKARSDPGYYGRDYAFHGDAVVETPALTAVFWSARGCVTVYSKQDLSWKASEAEPADRIGMKIVDVAPVLANGMATALGPVEVVRNADDEILLKVSFSGSGSAPSSVLFEFDKTRVVGVKPAGSMNLVRLSSRIEYGIAPSFIGDDLTFAATEHPATGMLSIPCENLFLGLLEGEGGELVVTWPKGNQRVKLRLGEEDGKPRIQSVDFDHGGQTFYLAALRAPGIWHKEALRPDFLEKDVKIPWRRPFSAKWKTQLYEEDLKTTFAFRESKGQIWRGVAGSYIYPVWFEGDDAFYHLSKKVQPKGESLIYCLEGRDTPPTVSTPSDVLKETLGRQASEPILDLAGRRLRTHHRRGGDGVRRACTCGCTEAIQAVFESGKEVDQKDYIQEALGDMIYFVHRHVERINEYRQFADGVLKAIQSARQSSPALKPFLDSLEEIAREIPQECDVQKENMKSFAYADELAGKTMALTAKRDPGNVKAYMELLKAWREMGGAQDYVVAKCHMVTRSLHQAAGYGCATMPDALPLAEEIRARCRQTLRNPDGYEIWADY